MQNNSSAIPLRRRSRLAPGECGDAYALMQDRFQSPRARKRALALILIDQGARPDAVIRRTGVGMKSQFEMLRRLAAHGVQAAIFGSPRRLDQRRYNVRAIVQVMRECLASRPPDGALSWNLVHLTAVVRNRVAGAEVITKETVRYLLKKELGINSIWDVDPWWRVQIKQGMAGSFANAPDGIHAKQPPSAGRTTGQPFPRSPASDDSRPGRARWCS